MASSVKLSVLCSDVNFMCNFFSFIEIEVITVLVFYKKKLENLFFKDCNFVHTFSKKKLKVRRLVKIK